MTDTKDQSPETEDQSPPKDGQAAPPPGTLDCCAGKGGACRTFGLLALIGLIALAAWLWRGGFAGGDSADALRESYLAAAPSVVVIGGGESPVVTPDDVTGAFFSFYDMATPAETRMAVTPLFTAHKPEQAWIFVDARWAAALHDAALSALIEDLQKMEIETIVILAPQPGETDDNTIDRLASLSHRTGVVFLDYHDPRKVSEDFCLDGALATRAALDTQHMLLNMAIHAPATRPHLRLADIGARIEKISTGTECLGAAAQTEEDEQEQGQEQAQEQE